MNIKIHYNSIGCKILQAIKTNSENKATQYNKKQAIKYLSYCITTGDKILIEYAKKLTEF